MGRFNLIDDPWIEVLLDKKGTRKLVSLRQIFENSADYIDICGDMHIQDFAVMRLVLAIMHTVFSRYDADGDPYDYLKINDKMQQLEKVDEDNYESYMDDLLDTWENIWKMGKFPQIIIDYLECWKDSFYLYDDKRPFYQVTDEYMSLDKIKGKTIGQISGKNINRTITESDNKVALFAPKSANENNKEILTDDEIARWLITFQSYTGLADKTVYGKEKYKRRNSKGWLYDLGAIFFKGSNLFETLILNFVIYNKLSDEYTYNIQKPAWELTDDELINFYLDFEKNIDNIAGLYTAYSRALFIDPNHKQEEPFSMKLIKLPEVNHADNFLEPMTLFKYNNTGENKGQFTPKKHPANQSMWRYFGQIKMSYENYESENKDATYRKPGIIDWFDEVSEIVDLEKISLVALSLEDDGNATSWVPINEIYDRMNMNIDVFIDDLGEGWIFRINKMVNYTKKIVGGIYGGFLKDIEAIRNLKKSDFAKNKVEQMYAIIDKPFRDMIEAINKEDSMIDTEVKWKSELNHLIYREAKKIFEEAGASDYTMKQIVSKDKDGKDKKEPANIATAFNKLCAILYKYGKEEDDGKK